jgi:hypothetical protein
MDLELVAWGGWGRDGRIGEFFGRREEEEEEEEEWGWKALERCEAETGSTREGDASGDDDEEARGGVGRPGRSEHEGDAEDWRKPGAIDICRVNSGSWVLPGAIPRAAAPRPGARIR